MEPGCPETFWQLQSNFQKRSKLSSLKSSVANLGLFDESKAFFSSFFKVCIWLICIGEEYNMNEVFFGGKGSDPGFLECGVWIWVFFGVK